MKTRELWKLYILALGMVIIVGIAYRHRSKSSVSLLAPTLQPFSRSVPAAASTRPSEDVSTLQKTAQRNADQHAAYLKRYLNPNSIRTSGMKMIGAVTADENGKWNPALSVALASHLASQTTEIASSFFTPEFISDGLFDSIREGSGEPLRQLELAKTLDALLLGREQVQYTTNPDLLNVITANMQLEIALVPVTGKAQANSWTFLANGAGFTRPAARKLAEERIIKQIVEDKKMSLE